MTVAELIELLQKQPPNATVKVDRYEGDGLESEYVPRVEFLSARGPYPETVWL